MQELGTPIMIGLAVAVALFVVAIVLALKMRNRNKGALPEKYEKERTHSVLVDRLRRYQNILIFLPPHYLPRELKMMVVLGMISNLEQLKKLQYEGEEEKIRNKLESAHELLAQLNVQTRDPDPRPITRPEKAKQAREILDSVTSFILYMTDQKQMDPKRTDEYLTIVERLKVQTSLDLLDSSASLARDSGRFDEALDAYRQAVEMLSGKVEDEYYVDQIAIYNDRINQLTRVRSEQDQASAPV